MNKIQMENPKKDFTFDNHVDNYDEDLDTSNHVLHRNGTSSENAQTHVKISDNRRPIYGVLTEPLRGKIRNKKDLSQTFTSEEDYSGYIPKAHVQFLEQSGIVVVPISFSLSEAEILEELEKVNGIYIHGDSDRSIDNVKYQHAFSVILEHVKRSNKDSQVYYPMFLMGKAFQSFVRKIGLSNSLYRNMYKYRNQNLEVKLLKEYNDTFILHPLQFDESNAHSFTLGKFFSKQHTGFRAKDLRTDEALKQWITPIATFKGTADAQNQITINEADKEKIDEENEFVAIAEGLTLPIYIFTYNLEMTQFVYTDLYKNPDQEECIDKSLLSRHHAQFISH